LPWRCYKDARLLTASPRFTIVTLALVTLALVTLALVALAL